MRKIQFNTDFFYVGPKHLRQGIGTRLVNVVLQDAFARGNKEGVFFSSERFESSGWHFHDQRPEFFYAGTCVINDQIRRIYKVHLSYRNTTKVNGDTC
jgi:hypothetical protein